MERSYIDLKRREEAKVETEVEIGMMWPKQGDECWQQLETIRGKGWILPYSLWRECGPTETLISDIWPPDL